MLSTNVVAMTRDQMIATLTLHGFEPTSKMLKGRGPSVSITVLWRREDQRTLRLEKGTAIYTRPSAIASHRMVEDGGNRQPRDWKGLSTPTLRLLLVRLDRAIAKQAERLAADADVPKEPL